jgi:TetR/AcrR family transcriptional regulator, transcriptional repressor for nem operon
MADALTHKERTRARILEEAAREMRLSGTDGIGVTPLMKRVGLTQGGFYAHFASRDDLVAHAIDRMFEDSRALIGRYLDGKAPAEGLTLLIDNYLSDRARLAPERTCPIPSLSSEAARLPDAARARFAAGVARFQRAIADRLDALGKPDPQALAASIMAEMVGAMTLARALETEGDESAILAASRERLKARLGL